jgi:DNA polymerase zeta
MKYETPEEKEPEFEAKGIETVRRDGIPANQKILEKSLK